MSKSIEEALIAERKNVDFSPKKISQFLYGKQFSARLIRELEKRPVLKLDLNLHNGGRIEILKQTMRDFPYAYNHTGKFMDDDVEFIYSILNSHNQMPSSVHYGMFVKCIEIMGTEEQKLEYLDKCMNLQIHGCYAQTQMGHGSDVRSLLTTATYEEQSQEFIVESPNIQSIKFWPGDLGLFSTHALVYATLFIKGKNHGIQSFIVPIRDPKTMAALPGIQVGDIGPKIGFFSKDNGYLIMNKVKIPRKNMLAKFTEVLPNGQFITKGDPKINYATMMEIRKQICCNAPKLYTQVITIATRYSMFRRQFKNSAKQEIKVIDYQLQQQKIISRVAEYFTVTVAGNKINKLCQDNLHLAQKGDFSLMAETHACLSLGKPLISEIVYDGMQISRKACGGHGFSHYSGLPQLINQYACHLTHEGQNTVLYLQVARHLLKSYKNFVTKKGSLGQSVKYIQSFDHLTSSKIKVNKADQWSLDSIRVLFAQGVCYLLSVVTEKMMNKQQGVSALQVWNKHSGSRLKQLGMHHGIYYLFNSFKEAVDSEKDQRMKSIASDLCMLFGANMILSYSSPIIQGGYITNNQIKTLNEVKKQILKRIRPILIGIVDGFGIPDKYIRSALISGNPYQNYIKLARQNSLNHSKLQSANVVKTIKHQIRNPNPKL